MNFLTPIWLLSIAAITIPLLIHLWNITPGKTLKVGSISLIQLSSRKRSYSLKLVDILLLFLRCLFIILLAFVLALPYFKNQVDRSKEKGWLLIPKEAFKEAYQKFKPKTDSLLKAGYELHYFNPGFTKVALSKALTDTSANQSTETYWNLLQQIAQKHGAELSIYLITPNSLNKYRGDRPGLDLKLTWQTYTPADSTSTLIKKAWFTPNKDVRVAITTSSPTQTFQRVENVNPASSKNSPYSIEFRNGVATISLKSDDKNKAQIDTSTLSADVFSAPGSPDGDYVKAALQSIGQFTQQNIVVKTYSVADNLQTKHDWLFWLFDKPLDAKTLSHYKNVFVYESGKTKASTTWINYAGDNSLQSGVLISIAKTIISNNDNIETVWQDGFGSPLLTTELKQQTRVYHFYSKFNPAWNDLVWSATFPQIIQKLIYPDESTQADQALDKRKIDPTQIKPDIIKQVNEEPISRSEQIDTSHYFWLLMVLIFTLERWLAHKKAGRTSVA